MSVGGVEPYRFLAGLLGALERRNRRRPTRAAHLRADLGSERQGTGGTADGGSFPNLVGRPSETAYWLGRIPSGVKSATPRIHRDVEMRRVRIVTQAASQRGVKTVAG